jgi:hypothetical protein
MPIYYVYDVQTGVIVHRHRGIDATTGHTVACSREDVLSVVDDSLPRNNLEVLEVTDESEDEHQQLERTIRVDPKTRELIVGE